MNRGTKQAVFFDILHETTTINVSTPQEIRDVFTKYRNTYIPKGVALIIQLQPGVYEFTEYLDLGHWCGDHIIVRGAEGAAGNMTAVTANDSTNKRLSFTVSNASAFAAGDYVMITGAGGTGRVYNFNGILRVASVSGSTVTIEYPYKKAMTILAGTTVTTGTMRKFDSVLKFNGCHGIYAEHELCAQLDDVAIVGNGAANTYGIYIHDSSLFTPGRLGVTGFGSHGIYIHQAYFGTYSSQYGSVQIMSCGNGGHGVWVAEDGCFYPGIINSVGNGGAGLALTYGARAHITTAYISGNGGNGLVATGAICTANGCYVGDNLNWGIYSSCRSYIQFGSCNAYANGTYDCIAQYVSFLQVQSLPTYIVAPVLYGTKNTLNGNGGYILAP